MSLEENWNEIVSQVRQNYPDRKIEEKDDFIEVKFDPSTFLMVEKDGFAEGSMHKHHFQSKNVTSVTVENSIAMIEGEDFEYLFKE